MFIKGVLASKLQVPSDLKLFKSLNQELFFSYIGSSDLSEEISVFADQSLKERRVKPEATVSAGHSRKKF